MNSVVVLGVGYCYQNITSHKDQVQTLKLAKFQINRM